MPSPNTAAVGPLCAVVCGPVDIIMFITLMCYQTTDCCFNSWKLNSTQLKLIHCNLRIHIIRVENLCEKRIEELFVRKNKSTNKIVFKKKRGNFAMSGCCGRKGGRI